MSLTPDLAILVAIAYADVFNYALSLEELRYRLPLLTKNIDVNKIEGLVVQSRFGFGRQSDLVVLPGRSELFKLRRQKQAWLSRIEPLIDEVGEFLKKIPLVDSAYLTGSLAAKNPSSEGDDIDLLVVCRPGSLWLCRFLVVVLAKIKGKYQGRFENKKNGWCFNLWLESDGLTLAKKDRSLYTAYEVYQSRELFAKIGSLVETNDWVFEYLICAREVIGKREKSTRRKPEAVGVMVRALNYLAFLCQWIYMSPKQTIEKVGLKFAFFHPRQTKQTIASQLEARLLGVRLTSREVRAIMGELGFQI